MQLDSILLKSLFSLAAVFGACACHRAAPPLVVWIEVDTLRADALGCYGSIARGENDAAPSPNVDALAQDGVRFERAYSAAPWTIPSLVTQLSGLWPWEHGVQRLLEIAPEESVPLVPLLHRHGVRAAGVMGNFVATKAWGFARGFERWEDRFATGHEGSSAHEALGELLHFADLERPRSPQGLLLFGWLFEPHYRYEEHAGFRFGPGFGAQSATPYTGTLRGDEELDDLLARRAELGEQDREFLRGHYQSEVAWLDHALGEFIAGLKQRGLYDEAWIVFTADHGEEILDRGWIGHSVTLHEELVHVPLIIKPPRSLARARAGCTVPEFVSTIDLSATIFGALTGAEPERTKLELGHSRSLAPLVLGETSSARRWLYLHTNFEPARQNALADEKRAHRWGVIDATSGMEWIVDRKVGPGERPRVELYDLWRDPHEAHDLSGDPVRRTAAKELERLRALVPTPIGNEALAPALLSEEPWTAGRK